MREGTISFFTATIIGWKHLLKPDKYKKIVVDSLKYRVNENTIFRHAFIVMPNHLYLI